ncbi:hypothetical protein ACFL2C_02870 [Patescibacteria group bacterium]
MKVTQKMELSNRTIYKALKSFSVVAILLFLFSVSVGTIKAEEILLIDQEVQFTHADNGFHVLKNNGENIPGAPINWLNPDDYYNGMWHFRYEILNPPLNNTPGRLQTCIWNMPGHSPEICADQTPHDGTVGAFFANEAPVDWWRNGGVPLSFSNSTPFLIRAVLRGENGCNVTRHAVARPCWELFPLYEPMRFRVSVVMVSADDTFSGWEAFGLSGGGGEDGGGDGYWSRQGGGIRGLVPVASTSCFHECVWDDTESPPCKIRNSTNVCGLSADKSDCENITHPFVCGFASFDCVSADSCAAMAIPLSADVDQAVYCDGGGNPTDDATITGQLYTAIGCVPIDDIHRFVLVILPVSLSLAGGVAILLIIFASYMIKTSAGDPRRLQSAKELLTAAMAGLILVILSIFILRVVSVDILRIPGL